jgi:hypothetical protein
VLWLRRLVTGVSPREHVFAPRSVHVGFVVDKMALADCSPSFSVFLLLVIIPPLRHTHLSRPHEVCVSCNEAAHYHTLGPKLVASYLSRHLVGLEVIRYVGESGGLWGTFLSRDFQLVEVYLNTFNEHSHTLYCFLYTTEA